MSILSAGCIAWLDRAKPAFAMLAAVALAYQAWLVWRRPRRLRTRSMLLILWASVGTSGAVAVLTMFFTWRYR